MARLTFIFKNMTYFFKSEKILSVLILLGMIVCDTIFLIFGNIFWSDAKNNEYEIYKNNVVVLEINASDIESFLRTTGSRDYVTSAFFRYTEFDAENMPITISAYSPSFDPDGQRIRLGHGLTGAGMECMINNHYKSPEVIGPSGSIIGKELRFLDADWVCTGIIAPSMADNFDILINMADFKAHVKNQVIAGFRYKNGTSLVEIQTFANFLSKEFHAKFVTVPSRTAGTGFGEFLSDMSEMLVLMVIAVINYMFLYRFLLEKRMYAYGIFKLHGMCNCLLLVGLCAEMLIFLTAAFSVSLLFYFGGTALFGQIDTVTQHVPEFWFSFAIIGVINLFFFGLAAVKLIRSSPVELIRESVVG